MNKVKHKTTGQVHPAGKFSFFIFYFFFNPNKENIRLSYWTIFVFILEADLTSALGPLRKTGNWFLNSSHTEF